MHRNPCDYVEFHCTLIRADALQRLGPFDEGLLSLHEHIDLGLRVRDAGGSAYFEPRSVVSYVPPPPYDSHDFPFFMMRWSDAWNRATVERFKEKWGYETMRYFGDTAPPGSEDTILRWARGHRRRMTGLRLSEEGEGSPKSPLEEAQYMVALFLSIDRDSFDLRLADHENIVEEASRPEPSRRLRPAFGDVDAGRRGTIFLSRSGRRRCRARNRWRFSAWTASPRTGSGGSGPTASSSCGPDRIRISAGSPSRKGIREAPRSGGASA